MITVRAAVYSSSNASTVSLVTKVMRAVMIPIEAPMARLPRKMVKKLMIVQKKAAV